MAHSYIMLYHVKSELLRLVPAVPVAVSHDSKLVISGRSAPPPPWWLFWTGGPGWVPTESQAALEFGCLSWMKSYNIPKMSGNLCTYWSFNIFHADLEIKWLHDYCKGMKVHPAVQVGLWMSLARCLRCLRQILGHLWGVRHLRGPRLLSFLALEGGWGGAGYIITSLARPHTYVMQHYCTLSLTSFISTQTSCLRFHTYVMLRCCRFFQTYVMLRCCRFSCTSTHTSCYAAVGSLDDGNVVRMRMKFMMMMMMMMMMVRMNKDDVDDDGDVDIAYETKVSFLSLFQCPHKKMFEKWRQSRAFQLPGTMS